MFYIYHTCSAPVAGGSLMPPLFLHDQNSKSSRSLFLFRKAFHPEYMFTSSQSLQTLPFSENICLSLIISNHKGFFQLRWTFARFILLATFATFQFSIVGCLIDPPAFILWTRLELLHMECHWLCVCVCGDSIGKWLVWCQSWWADTQPSAYISSFSRSNRLSIIMSILNGIVSI